MKEILNNLSMRTKLMISYIIVFAVVIIGMLSLFLYYADRHASKEMRYSAESSLEQTQSLLNFKTASIRDILNIFSANNSLQTLLKKNASDYDIGSWQLDNDELQKLFLTAQSTPDMTDIQLYMWNGPASFLESSYIHNLRNYITTPFYQNYNFNTRHLSWYRGQDFLPAKNADNIIVLKNIPDMENYANIIGVVRLQFSKSIFSDTLNLAKTSPNTITYLASDSQIIASSDLNSEREGKVLQGAYNIIHDNSQDQIESGTDISLDGAEYILYFVPIKNSKWSLYMLIPYSDIRLSSRSITIVAVISSLSMLIVSIFAAWILSEGYTKRLRILSQQMRNIDDSSIFFKELPAPSKDEVGVLTQNFNYMLYHISMLLDEKYKMGKAIKNAELIALQEQINPHFLYNTLDQIYWLSVRYKNPEISELVLNLSKFYKLSLSKGKSKVPLFSELEHVNTYVEIQNNRFDYPITLQTDIDENVKNFELPKLTLQPLIENAIIHGISPKDSPGMINISAHQNDRRFILIISDNGIGIDPEQLSALQSMFAGSLDTESGYGLQNVRNRLLLTFNGNVNISIESTINVGTKIQIEIWS